MATSFPTPLRKSLRPPAAEHLSMTATSRNSSTRRSFFAARDSSSLSPPPGLNRILFSFATIMVHDVLQTNHEKPWINNTTSYFDLSTRHGNAISGLTSRR
ncbi:hypothetical protein CF336_g5603 [Tilletia laevis]|nr:hypothetical protein CF336_g5603 [Tilletia laevis]